MSSPPNMTNKLCHPWHHDGTHVTYGTDMESMTPSWQRWHHTVLELGKDDSGVKQWHNMAQYVILCPLHLTITYMLCHPWHHDGTHVTYGTDMESMTPSWQRWHHTVLELGKGDSGLNNGTICNLCPRHITITYMLCHPWHHDVTHVTCDTESMTPSWQQWHHTVLELGKDDSGVKQWHDMAQYVIYVLSTSPLRICYVTHTPRWHPCHLWHRINGTIMATITPWHNMAQYVIYVLATSPWRICYVTHDITMAPMSPMTQNQWQHHGNNDTTLSWSWERTILVLNNGTIWHNM